MKQINSIVLASDSLAGMNIALEKAAMSPWTICMVGTAARSGLKKLLMGNTAEGIVGRLHGDIVTVR